MQNNTTNKPLNQNKMLEINGIKFHKLDEDDEIQIEVEGWGHYMSINQTKELIDFLTNELKSK